MIPITAPTGSLPVLRDYQASAVDATIAALASNPVLVSATGSGKTVMGAALVDRLASERPRVLWLAHRRELIHQAAESLRRLGLRVGEILAGTPAFPNAPVQVASVQTLVRRDPPIADLVVIDEAHHARATTYGRVLGFYPQTPRLGLTATPFRLDGKGLGDVFGQIIVAAYTDDLVATGTLIEPVVYAPAEPDLSAVHLVHGDYNLGEIGRIMAAKQIVGDIVKTWQTRAAGRRTVVFATNVEHSRSIIDAFRAAGVKAEHLDGATSKTQRDAILHRLRVGYTAVVSNCAVLTEGWDLPALEVAVIARPTASLCLHLQMLGRIMRSAEGKGGALVLDHAGNHLRLGFVTQRVDYSLDDGVSRERGEAKPSAASKRCPACYLVLSRSATECPECGHVFKTEAVKHVEGELHELRPGSPRASVYDQQALWNVIESQRQALGYKESWSFYRFKDRMGFSPLVVAGRVVDPASASVDTKRAVYEKFAAVARERGFKPGFAAVRYRETFGVWPRFQRRSA